MPVFLGKVKSTHQCSFQVVNCPYAMINLNTDTSIVTT